MTDKYFMKTLLTWKLFSAHKFYTVIIRCKSKKIAAILLYKLNLPYIKSEGAMPADRAPAIPSIAIYG